jgi:hypothetical protein
MPFVTHPKVQANPGCRRESEFWQIGPDVFAVPAPVRTGDDGLPLERLFLCTRAAWDAFPAWRGSIHGRDRAAGR